MALQRLLGCFFCSAIGAVVELPLLKPVCPFSGTAFARLRSYCACKVPFEMGSLAVLAAPSPCHFEGAFLCHFDRAQRVEKSVPPSLCHFDRAQRVEKSR